VIDSVKNFFRKKRVGWTLALLAATAMLATSLPMPFSLRGALRAFGLAMMIALAPIWYADWKQHKPTSKDFSSKSFFVVYTLLVPAALFVSAVALKKYFTNLH
jgi:hypothetical protein